MTAALFAQGLMLALVIAVIACGAYAVVRLIAHTLLLAHTPPPKPVRRGKQVPVSTGCACACHALLKHGLAGCPCSHPSSLDRNDGE